jgi:ketosteroid isomerase-like protein
LTPGTLLLRGRRVAVELGSGSRTMVLFERRSGEDRRTERRINEDGGAGPGQGVSEDARWPLSFEDGVDGPRPRDPWAALVLRSIRDYSLGRPDLAQSAWDDAITWRVEAEGPTPADAGAQAIHAYHRRLLAETDGSFSQLLRSLACSGGPIVEAHVRTTASRPGRTLDQPSLVVFELADMRIRAVTEIPGDRASWEAFWADRVEPSGPRDPQR